MRLHVVPTVMLLAYVDASSVNSQSDLTNSATPDQGNVSAHTFRQNGTSTDKEERGISISMSDAQGITHVVESMGSIDAERVRIKEQLQKARDVFNSLKLNEGNHSLLANLLTDQRFLQWKDFVTQSNKIDPYITMVKILSTRFNDVVLARKLEAATNVNDTKDVATKLQKAQLDVWHSHQLRYDELFKRLLLSPKLKVLISNPLYKVWFLYVKKLERFPNVEVVKVLSSRLGEVDLARMLEVATMDNKMKDIALTFQEAQFDIWKRDKVGLDVLLDRLGLDPTSDGLLHNPLLHTWFKYAEKTQKKSPTASLIQILSARSDYIGFTRMLESATTVGSTERDAIRLQGEQLSAWQRDRMPYEMLFKYLKLSPKSYNLLGDPMFNVWYKYVKKLFLEPDELVMQFLQGRFVDVGLAWMLEAATKVDKTKDMATKLQNAQFDIWRKLGYHDGSIFEALKLRQKIEDLFDNPLFNVWYKFVLKENRFQYLKVVHFLVARYNFLDFTRMLEVATKNADKSVIATDLQGRQMLEWKTRKVSIEELFEDLGLDRGKNDLLRNHLFNVWYKYVQTIVNNPSFVAVKFLKAGIDDIEFARMLEAATKVGDTKKVATSFQREQFCLWGRDGLEKLKLMEYLGLDLKSDGIFRNPLFLVWCKAVRKDVYNMYLQAINILVSRYDEIDLANILEAATRVDSTKVIATALQKSHFTYWADRDVSVEALFRRFALNPTSADLLSNPLFNVWCKYVKKLQKKDPDLAIIDFLSPHWNDISLAKMVQAATQIDSTKDIAETLQSGQIKAWQRGKVNDEGLFELLELDKTGDNLFHNPLFLVWYKYVKWGEWGAAWPVIQFLWKRFDDISLAKKLIAATEIDGMQEIAAKLLLQQINAWSRNNVLIKEILERLKLDLASDDLFRNPSFKVWYWYVRKQVVDQDLVVIKLLAGCYNEIDLARKLEVATQVDVTKDIATRLQHRQMTVWRDKQIRIDALFEQLMLDQPSDDLFGNPLFNVWKKYVEMVEDDPNAAVVEFLKTHFDSISLAKMLKATANADSMKDIVSRLRNAR